MPKTSTATAPPAEADLPAVAPEAVCALYRDVLEAETFGASSNDVAQILDDWFVEHGFPTILYRS
jgi:hypothetical protein